MRRSVSMNSAPCKLNAISAQKNLNALERIDIEKLGMIVNRSIKAVSAMNDLTNKEVIRVLEKIQVTTIGEVQKAVENIEGMEDIDAVRLAVGIEETIKAISGITNLDVGEITETFANKRGASVEDIVNRLHAKSKAACSDRA